jgi:hypothetical protein
MNEQHKDILRSLSELQLQALEAFYKEKVDNLYARLLTLAETKSNDILGQDARALAFSGKLLTEGISELRRLARVAGEPKDNSNPAR